DEILLLHEEWISQAAEPEIAKRREVNLASVTSETLQETLRGGVGKGILDELRGVLDEMEASFRAADNLPAAILSVQIGKDMVDQETGQRGFIITGEESFLDPYNAGQKALDDHIAELRALLRDDPANSNRLDRVESLANDWVVQAAVPEIQARRDVDANPATIADVAAIVESGVGKNILDQMRAKFDEFIQIEVDLNQQHAAEASQQNQNIIVLALGLTALGAVITLAVGIFTSRNITSSLTAVTVAAQTIIGGDLSREVEVTSKDEVGILASTFNTMTNQLRTTLSSLDKRTKDQAVVAEVATTIANISDLQEMIENLVRLTQRGFGLYHAHVFIYNETTEELEIVACGYKEGEEHEGTHGTEPIPLAQEQSLVARAGREQTPVIVNDVRSDPNWLPNALLPDTHAEMAVPMLIGGRLLGVLDVQADHVDAFTQEDANIKGTLAAQAAVAMQNIQEHATSQKIASDLGVVTEVGIATATITDRDQLLQEVVDLSKESFKLYHAHIYLMNEEGDTLQLAAGAGEVGRQMAAEGRSISLDSEKSLVARAARTHEGVVVNDVTDDADFLPNPLLPDTHAEMAVPMILGGRVLGVLDVQSETVGRFTQIDINVKTTLAAQIAVALENARSFQEAQKRAERETRLSAISQKILNTTTIEEAMQITARELGHALGKRQTLVSLDAKTLSGKSNIDDDRKNGQEKLETTETGVA
ncbi:MAG TPA: GAF domain-containing protein, partial [Anaerolineales bacterium]|nr:GAF domain-containing protein [Anaerolineales bacterium]